MRIDVPAHYWTEEYLDLLIDLGKADAGAARGVGAGADAELAARLRLMDRAGIVLGTDFPYENGDIFVRAVDYINDPQIDPDAARAILDHNASALLGIGQERQGTTSSSVRTR